MGAEFQASRKAVLVEYVPLLYQMVMKELKKGEKDSVLEAVKTLQSQHLNVELFKENIITMLMDSSGAIYNDLEPKTKSAFTRIYN